LRCRETSPGRRRPLSPATPSSSAPTPFTVPSLMFRRTRCESRSTSATSQPVRSDPSCDLSAESLTSFRPGNARCSLDSVFSRRYDPPQVHSRARDIRGHSLLEPLRQAPGSSLQPHYPEGAISCPNRIRITGRRHQRRANLPTPHKASRPASFCSRPWPRPSGPPDCSGEALPEESLVSTFRAADPFCDQHKRQPGPTGQGAGKRQWRVSPGPLPSGRARPF
jgi:hypothetical protein